MKTTLQRAVCLLLSSALLLSLGACGKKKEKENSVRDVAEETSAETTQEMRKVESHEGKIGEQVTDQEVVATLKKAYVSDYTFTENDQEIGLTFFEFEIQEQQRRGTGRRYALPDVRFVGRRRGICRHQHPWTTVYLPAVRRRGRYIR